MKLFSIILSVFFCTAAFAKSPAVQVNGKKVAIDAAKSKFTWVGEKKIGSKHEGSIVLKSGHVLLDGEKITGGEFTVDMTSIANSDLKDKSWNDKLVNHLKSEDFFKTDAHPTAHFVVTKVTPQSDGKVKIQGQMTVRGATHPESMIATVNKDGKILKAVGELKFNRLKYGITFNSESNALKNAIKLAKDKIINDQVAVQFELATVSI